MTLASHFEKMGTFILFIKPPVYKGHICEIPWVVAIHRSDLKLPISSAFLVNYQRVGTPVISLLQYYSYLCSLLEAY